MAEQTGISWCDATFNPWIGCEKVSPGCAHCYAETLVTGSGPRQMNRPGTWGPDGTRQRTSASTWAKPRRWDRLAREGRLPNGAENPDGHRPRVFCASLADVFEPRPELEPWREELFDLIAATPALDWLVLTKRPDVARDWLPSRCYHDVDPYRAEPVVLPLPNVWLGTSIENARHTYRADQLRECPAALRFLSCEPLLGSLYPRPFDCGCEPAYCRHRALYAEHPPKNPRVPLNLDGIDWVIVGGESGGRNARPMHPQWAREIRDAVLRHRPRLHHPPFDYTGPSCSSPAFHLKQWGSWSQAYDDDEVLDTGSENLHYFPDGVVMRYRGPTPTSGGKLLDRVDWCEFPDSPAAAVPATAGSLF